MLLSICESEIWRKIIVRSDNFICYYSSEFCFAQYISHISGSFLVVIRASELCKSHLIPLDEWGRHIERIELNPEEKFAAGGKILVRNKRGSSSPFWLKILVKETVRRLFKFRGEKAIRRFLRFTQEVKVFRHLSPLMKEIRYLLD